MTSAHTDLGVTLNDAQKVFVLPAGGGGYSCFGYENCMRDSKALAEKLDRADLMPGAEMYGTVEGYFRYRELLGLASKKDIGTWFTPGTPKVVESILSNAIRTGDRLKLTLGDKDTGRMWGERSESGTIARSGGTLKTPILIPNRRSTGGCAILTDCIVKIEASSGGRVMWAHPTLHAEPAKPEAGEPEAEAHAPAP